MDTQNKFGSFTFGYIKPHLVRSGGIGLVKQIIQDSGFEIVHSEKTRLSKNQVIRLYPHLIELFPESFYDSETVLSNTCGEVELMVLWSNNNDTAKRFRQLIGHTDGKGLNNKETLRGRFAINLFQNAIHGSDTEQNAIKEIRVINPRIVDEILNNDKFRDRFYSLMERVRQSEGNVRIEKG